MVSLLAFALAFQASKSSQFRSNLYLRNGKNGKDRAEKSKGKDGKAKRKDESSSDDKSDDDDSGDDSEKSPSPKSKKKDPRMATIGGKVRSVFNLLKACVRLVRQNICRLIISPKFYIKEF